MMAVDDDTSAREHVEEILEISAEALDDVNRLSGDIRPVQLERQGLTSTLRSTLASVSDSARLDIDVNIDDVDGLVSPAQEIDIYRIVQEGINNIVRHSGASRASVTVKRVDGTLLLEIDDNGRGFVDGRENSGVMQSGFGLQAMKERVRVLHGLIDISSETGAGARIRVSIPVTMETKVIA
jgi:signal transduction histidine kinase